jgi:hypothetical protein
MELLSDDADPSAIADRSAREGGKDGKDGKVVAG